ncbi:MAG: hypothetical protein GY797_16845 [Deltaproteobacteria bacterium]|nr:hypothetical protein [Deltaproteobacteria bacterium]
MDDITFNYRVFFEKLTRKISVYAAQIIMVLREDNEFLLQWVTANTAAGLGIFVGISLYSLTFNTSHPLLFLLGILVSGVLGVVAQAALFGVMQWLVLKQRIKQISGIVWTLGTTLTLPLSFYLAFLSTNLIFKGILDLKTTQLYSFEYYLIYLITVGALLGTVQWRILRAYIYQAHWWILASIIGVSIGAGSTILIYNAYIFVSFPQVENILFWGTLGGIVGGALFGIATCIPLSWLLRRQIT